MAQPELTGKYVNLLTCCKIVKKRIMPNTPTPEIFLTALLVTSLSACSWVDSAGNQGTEAGAESDTIEVPAEVSSETTLEVPLETTPKLLQSDVALDLLENTISSALLTGSDGASSGWTWDLIGEGEDLLCNSVSDFDAELSVNSLAAACTYEDQCSVVIQSPAETGTKEFTIQLPRLKAPVALEYSLVAESGNGVPLERQQVLCALSVNEAPTAVADSYRALAGVELRVHGDDANNLLRNDSDDDDVRNAPLHIDTSALVPPLHADVFSVDADGGFTYRLSSSVDIPAGGELIDSFGFSVSDGLHSINTTATISIVADNAAPSLMQSLPALEFDLLAGPENELTQGLNLSEFFTDPDEDPLAYTLVLSELPAGAAVEINEHLLSVAIDPQIYSATASGFTFEVIASDGLVSYRSEVSVLVNDSSVAANQAPTARYIDDLTVQGTFEYDVSVFFEDPDGHLLTFTSESLPPDVDLSSSGIITGTSTNRNAGTWITSITATDPFDESISTGFRFVIE